ncbi:protein translocase subunit SecF [Shewanella putrefaciens]|jgi:preprotein translocase subunit SecF|uniref:Protein-export membrane protein SecF n=2 Tax=Shewanella putrefaciens TaxID=24 RepID=E6XJ96_SHEP2|nr:protein translocase subunit SecF [Shewanella putrefaciens]AVV85694.1 preprotein translocase subunit SecF [Shewanella putrefaciens]QSE48517.1 protein translocase subunit SecF [Shewanella putrefaciens]QYX71923.1 protein translocase subunit SecF [Shewanella putrefaciens]SUI88178.1 preprotein translocase subunit SecF [Shewanella putrefaciens]GGN25122.1 protein-export membrane protein SecF [Shewanella putrefaciens]
MKNINLTGQLTQWRYISSAISIFLMLASLTIIGVKGFNWGLDFTGGVVTEVQLDRKITSSELQPLLNAAYQQEVSVVSASEPGRWVLRYADTAQSNVDIAQTLAPLGEIQVLNTSIVGPQVGKELAEQGGLALLVAMLCILGYLSYRFEWRLASGALFALVHDVIFVLAFFALTQMEFNLTVLAAVLAILGYSLNDSIIIADRIRELLIAKPKLAIQEINNQAIVATFSRTMVTSGTTLMTVGALWIMGGGPLEGFSIAMFIGILTGTFSSISVGTSLPELLGLSPEHYKVQVISDTP